MVKRDFFSQYYLSNENDVRDLINTRNKYSEIKDIMQKASLLATALTIDNIKNYAKVGERNESSGLKLLLHDSPAFNSSIQCRLSEIHQLGIDQSINISLLPSGTMNIELPITLKKPYISRDDVSFYIIDAPIRKEKAFGIPFTSARSWKGNLRWVMMKVFIEPEKEDIERFVEARIRHTLLFGTEKGMKDKKSEGWSKHLDTLCPNGKEKYQECIKEMFNTKEMPNIKGSLYFYPTFWDKIDLEVINPHDRQTKTGKNPIYFEVVPAGAQGNFHLLHMPHLIEIDRGFLSSNRKEIAQGLKEMMLTYGFSAKKSSGYGIIQDNWDKKYSVLAINEKKNFQDKFRNFNELISKIESQNDGVD
ncbi:MAG: RAMP superfamily CRISPR-associated protein [Promethearchaeota archaeon]